jgi:hypothetical protein
VRAECNRVEVSSSPPRRCVAIETLGASLFARRLTWHNWGVKQAHPHLGATYKTVRQEDKTFGVQVSLPDAFPTTITSFDTKADAERWIERRKNEVAKGVPERRRSNSRPQR